MAEIKATREDIQRIERIKDRLDILNSTFTPTQPVKTREIFAGRHNQLFECLSIAGTIGLHGILYGDRGVGKTSIANMVELIGCIEKPDCLVLKIECTSGDTFEEIIRRVYKKISIKRPAKKIGFTQNDTEDENISLEDIIPEKASFNPKDISYILKQTTDCLLVILDEFDRLNDSTFNLSSLTELMKINSDTGVDVHFLIVGVGQSVVDIIGNHASIVRNLNQIKLQFMNNSEIEEIIVNGIKKLNLSMNKSIIDNIINFSCGYPHYTHLLCHHACQNTIRADRNKVESPDLDYAIGRAISRAQESVRDSYQKATMANRTNIYKEVLLACGEAKLDEYNTFVPKDIEKPLSAILKRTMKVNQFGSHLLNLCKPNRGEILVSIGERGRARYRFRDPLMRAFVRINGGSKR